MHQPTGFFMGVLMFVRRKKSLYGLKQSPRAGRFSEASFCLRRTAADHSVYVTRSILLAVYVDDIVITGSYFSECTQALSK